MRRRKNRWAGLLLLAAMMLFSGCGEPPQSDPPLAGVETARSAAPTASPSEKTGDFQAPPLAVAEFHPDAAMGSGGALLDLSALSQGYVAVSARSQSRLKFQVVFGDLTYNYDLASDGTPSIFPLQCGNGTYLFRVMENVSESRYAELYADSAQVTMESEFSPFLCNSDYVAYNKTSRCVQKAGEIASAASGTVDVVAGVYQFVCDNITYDREKAMSVQSGYLPNPDATLEEGKGICFDYAALAAAMLRSQGIPTKMVLGYVSPNDLYHAWNMFYTTETGWVTVGFEAGGDRWNRIDLTFSAGGADGQFIGDGSNYTDLYYY